LIIGCGCRGRLLAGELRDRGHSVRGTTRDPARLADIEGVGAEAELADPDRVMTLMPALDHVSVALILLGSASGSPDEIRALHGTRLEMLLTKLVDTTVRGVVYEARGRVQDEVLSGGVDRVRRFAERSLARVAMLTADPALPQRWVSAALATVDAVVGGDTGAARPR
jgi:3-hydroxyisobutyrate dehydrogenase-like beta-hydroxyacid dehydrogenase